MHTNCTSIGATALSIHPSQKNLDLWSIIWLHRMLAALERIIASLKSDDCDKQGLYLCRRQLASITSRPFPCAFANFGACITKGDTEGGRNGHLHCLKVILSVALREKWGGGGGGRASKESV